MGKLFYIGFYGKYAYKQFSHNNIEVLYDGPILEPEKLRNDYGIILTPAQIQAKHKFIVIYKTKK